MEENKTEFYIEKMQLIWLKKGSEEKRNRLIFGLIFELIFGLISGLIFGLISGLISGLILGLIGGFNNFEEIKTYETIDFAWNLKTFLKIGRNVIYVLISGLIGGLIYDELISGLIGGLILGLILGLDALKGAEVENKIFPNYGIKKNINYMLIFIIIVTLLVVPLAYTIFRLNVKNKEILIGFCLGFPTLYGVIIIGRPVMQHLSLRLTFWSNGYAPWNYAKFLDYCTNRLFLQRVGGGYRFMHDLLRQHFANSYKKKNEQSVPASIQES